MNKEHLLEIKDLDVFYGNQQTLHDIELSMNEGEILGIVGESGSGKSTLIKAMMGLLGPEGKITSGNIWFKGKNLKDYKEEELRHMRGSEMSMIFQNMQTALCPIRTIESQIYESLLEHERMSKKDMKDRALYFLNKMHLRDCERILKSYPFELSGGMNQRVGIMMAMMMTPKLLLADEPTSALDVTVQLQIVKEMMALKAEYQTAIALVTHNIGVVEKMADSVAVMYKGQIIEYGKKEDVIEHPQEAYTKQLLASVIRMKGRIYA